MGALTACYGLPRFVNNCIPFQLYNMVQSYDISSTVIVLIIQLEVENIYHLVIMIE